VLRVSATVDYALRAAIVLARAHGRPVTVAEIAAQEELPTRFLSATLASMRHSGLLCSRRGGSGGFWLARPPSQISVADLICSVDGTVVDLGAVSEGSTAQVWQEAASRLEAFLAATSLAELAERASTPTV
jgi:Rrf2 family protein